MDRGARYVAQVRQGGQGGLRAAGGGAVRAARDLDVINEVHDLGIDSVGIHVETFDPQVLARVAPGKARTGIERYFAAWERAVSLFGEGQVSTYVILGMGEDLELTVAGCRRAIDMGVYPFVVPLRPVAGSLMQDAAAAVGGVHQQRLPPGRVLHGAARDGRQHGVGRLRALPGMLGDQQPPAVLQMPASQARSVNPDPCRAAPVASTCAARPGDAR